MPGPIGLLFTGVGLVIEAGFTAADHVKNKGKQPMHMTARETFPSSDQALEGGPRQSTSTTGVAKGYVSREKQSLSLMHEKHIDRAGLDHVGASSPDPSSSGWEYRTHRKEDLEEPPTYEEALEALNTNHLPDGSREAEQHPHEASIITHDDPRTSPNVRYHTAWADPSSDAWGHGPLNLISGGLLHKAMRYARESSGLGNRGANRGPRREERQERRTEKREERQEQRVERQEWRVEKREDRQERREQRRCVRRS